MLDCTAPAAYRYCPYSSPLASLSYVLTVSFVPVSGSPSQVDSVRPIASYFVEVFLRAAAYASTAWTPTSTPGQS
ncbi:hypothetical protein AB0I82_06600 [Streptomyces sp. NPDC050315]|uniref:hypothetical protein n=1 Tax=Streptomyces sp. NPDC050315 TaxID=3155039 RepID=UPI0034224100